MLKATAWRCIFWRVWGRVNTVFLRKRHIPWWSAQKLLLHGMSRIHGRLKQIRSRWTRHFWARWHRCYGCHLQSRTMHGAGHANKKVLTICYMLCTMYWYAKYGGCIGRKQNSILQAVIATRWYLLWVDISKFSHGPSPYWPVTVLGHRHRIILG